MDLEFAKRIAAKRCEVEAEIAENDPSSSCETPELTSKERWRNLGSRITALADHHYGDRDSTGNRVGTLHSRTVSLEDGTYLILELNARNDNSGIGGPERLSEISAIWRSRRWPKDSPLAIEKVNAAEVEHSVDYVPRELALIEQSVAAAEMAIWATDPLL
jgi:hypothetical protein